MLSASFPLTGNTHCCPDSPLIPPNTGRATAEYQGCPNHPPQLSSHQPGAPNAKTFKVRASSSSPPHLIVPEANTRACGDSGAWPASGRVQPSTQDQGARICVRARPGPSAPSLQGLPHPAYLQLTPNLWSPREQRARRVLPEMEGRMKVQSWPQRFGDFVGEIRHPCVKI